MTPEHQAHLLARLVSRYALQATPDDLAAILGLLRAGGGTSTGHDARVPHVEYRNLPYRSAVLRVVWDTRGDGTLVTFQPSRAGSGRNAGHVWKGKAIYRFGKLEPKRPKPRRP